jgi:RNA polymerase sigma-70 factor (ECF subfamily)
MHSSRYARERDLLRACRDGDQHARDDFRVVYRNTVVLAARRTFSEAQMPTQEIERVIAICVGEIYAQWDTLPRERVPLRDVIRRHATRFADEYLRDRRLAILPPRGGDLSRLFISEAARLQALLRVTLSLTPQEAEDAVQDVFLGLLARSDLPEDEAHLRNYVRQAVMNRGLDAVRRKTRQKQNEESIWLAIGAQASEEQLLASIESAQLREAIERLDEPYRAIFQALVSRDMSLIEIAHELGINPNSIYVQYSRGINHLRRRLGLP